MSERKVAQLLRVYDSIEDRAYRMLSSRLESGFIDVECFTILYIVTTRKMRLSCRKR